MQEHLHFITKSSRFRSLNFSRAVIFSMRINFFIKNVLFLRVLYFYWLLQYAQSSQDNLLLMSYAKNIITSVRNWNLWLLKMQHELLRSNNVPFIQESSTMLTTKSKYNINAILINFNVCKNEGKILNLIIYITIFLFANWYITKTYLHSWGMIRSR